MKCLSAGLSALTIGVSLGHQLPSARLVWQAGLVGAFSYGLSLLFDTYALSLIGAAREAAFFATAPFVGAVASLPILGESLGELQVVAAGLMVLGVVLLLRERHSHCTPTRRWSTSTSTAMMSTTSIHIRRDPAETNPTRIRTRTRSRPTSTPTRRMPATGTGILERKRAEARDIRPPDSRAARLGCSGSTERSG